MGGWGEHPLRHLHPDKLGQRMANKGRRMAAQKCHCEKRWFLRQKFQLKNDIINRCTKVWCNNKLANYIIIYH